MKKGRLIDIITQVAEEKQDKVSCPHCNSQEDKIKILGKSRTLVGGRWLVDGDKDDPNHYTVRCDCFGCNKQFTWEYKFGKQWFATFDQKIIKGVHGCFEEAIYTCNKCSADVKRTYTELDGVTETHGLRSGLENGKWKVFYRTFWNCSGCDNGIEVKSKD